MSCVSKLCCVPREEPPSSFMMSIGCEVWSKMFAVLSIILLIACAIFCAVGFATNPDFTLKLSDMTLSHQAFFGFTLFEGICFGILSIPTWEIHKKHDYMLKEHFLKNMTK